MPSLEDIVVEPPADAELIDTRAWFTSPGTFEIEIGCGKGGFLLSRARANSQISMLGIEWANKYFRFCADRMVRWGLTNVRVMRTDAKHLVLHHLPPASVSVLHVYHPDPWPKKRHHKRRLIQPDFADAVLRALVPSGLWMIQSDHAEYFEHIRRVLDPRVDLTEISWSDSGVGPGPDWEGTNFEVKYTRSGRTIYRVAYRKVE